MVFYSENAGAKSLLSTSSVAGALFGAIHCLAWHFSFPSSAEQIIWRFASLGIVGSCATTFYTVLSFFIGQRAERHWIDPVVILVSLGLPLCALACGLAILVYPVARITLLVIAIASLRSLPTSAFDTVDWIELVPHI